MQWSYAQLTVAAVGAAVLLAYLYGLRLVARAKYRHIPGPSPRWLWGNGRTFLGPKRIYAYQAAAQQYGKVFKVWNGAKPTVVVSDAEVGRLALIRNQVRSKVAGPGQFTFDAERKRRFESGLFSTQDRALHKSLKHAWLPSMNSATLADNAALMEASAERLITLLEAPARAGEVVNIWRHYGAMTLDVVGTAAFGVEFQTQHEGEPDAAAAELIEAVQTIFKYAGASGTIYVQLAKAMPELGWLWTALSLALPDKPLVQARKAMSHMDVIVEKLVRDARARVTQGADVEVHVRAGAVAAAGAAAEKGAAPVREKRARGVKPGSFPTMMVTARDPRTQQPLDDIVAAAQTATFLLAGYETTATTLGFTTYALARHPDKLAKLQEELDAASAGGPLTPERIAGLPYLEACFREAMRLYSPVVSVEREAEQDQVLCGHRIPKGTNLLVPIYSIQRDPAYWPSPTAYLPERWLEGAPEHHPHTPGAWVAFGEGSRICAGQRFALQEVKITLARLLSKYSFQLAPDQPDLEQKVLRGALTLAPDSAEIRVVPCLRAR